VSRQFHTVAVEFIKQRIKTVLPADVFAKPSPVIGVKPKPTTRQAHTDRQFIMYRLPNT
jgi:hypothetical protein